MSSSEVIGNIAVIVVLALIVFVVISLVRAVRIVPQSQAYVVERLGLRGADCPAVAGVRR